MKEPAIIIMMGRPGSGKGTQAALLAKEFGLDSIRASQLLLKRGETPDYTGKKIVDTIGKGMLIPSTFVMNLMMKKFDEKKAKGIGNGFILDGAPRKLFEAYMLQEALAWFGWNNVKLLNIVVSEKEAQERLSKRGRNDDDPEDIQVRFRLHTEQIEPALAYLKEQGTRIDINGEQSEEEVHAEMKAKLEL